MKIIRKDEWFCAECGAKMKSDPERPNVHHHPEVPCANAGKTVRIDVVTQEVFAFREPR
jgi:hypothetical protein